MGYRAPYTFAAIVLVILEVQRHVLGEWQWTACIALLDNLAPTRPGHVHCISLPSCSETGSKGQQVPCKLFPARDQSHILFDRLTSCIMLLPGQGLTAEMDKALGASIGSQRLLTDAYTRGIAADIRTTYRRMKSTCKGPTAARSGIVMNDCVLSSPAEEAQQNAYGAALLSTTSPSSYSSANLSWTDGVQVLLPSYQQLPCFTCTGEWRACRDMLQPVESAEGIMSRGSNATKLAA